MPLFQMGVVYGVRVRGGELYEKGKKRGLGVERVTKLGYGYGGCVGDCLTGEVVWE